MASPGGQSLTKWRPMNDLEGEGQGDSVLRKVVVEGVGDVLRKGGVQMPELVQDQVGLDVRFCHPHWPAHKQAYPAPPSQNWRSPPPPPQHSRQTGYRWAPFRSPRVAQ